MKRAIWRARVDSAGVRECGMLGENPSGTWESPYLSCPGSGRCSRKENRSTDGVWEVLPTHSTPRLGKPATSIPGPQGEESGDGVDGKPKPSKEASPRTCGGQGMPTSLGVIANGIMPDAEARLAEEPKM